MAAHSALTGADLHEPKGASTATSGQAYLANGSGSGSWQSLNSANAERIMVTIQDVSTAGSTWVVPAVAGIITQINTVLYAPIATTDCGLSFEIAGAPITDGNITIAFSGSAAGDLDSSSPSAARTLTNTQAIEIISNGASTSPASATVTFVVDVS